MCASCGCGSGRDHGLHRDGHEEHHHNVLLPHSRHGHDHDHRPHHHDHETPSKTILIEQAILAKNDRLAAQNRAWMSSQGIAAINLMSSPGAGKTTLLERTVADLGRTIPVAVIEGDQETERDAERIRAAGCRATQVNTGTGCHLDAAMIKSALHALEPEAGSLVFIENVGNLVCPALFDLGERRKVVIASITEGEDKPLKYPHMFRAAHALVLNKLDLLPHLEVNAERMIAHARSVNPRLEVFRVSAARGLGLESWYGWLREELGMRAVG
jgi:hydrogenase nickel incorporation protein HypB